MGIEVDENSVSNETSNTNLDEAMDAQGLDQGSEPPVDELEEDLLERIPLPEYRPRETIEAFKIKEVQLDSDKAREESRETDGSALLIPEDEKIRCLKVTAWYIRMHKPQVGGYYVRYEEGTESFQSAEKFESNYLLILQQR